MAESVAKMKAQHGLVPDFALIDGPYAPAALKEDPDVEAIADFEPDLDWTLALTLALTTAVITDPDPDPDPDPRTESDLPHIELNQRFAITATRFVR